MTVLAQVSDLHLDGSERRTARAAATLDHLRALERPVDGLLVSGDIADHGTREEYEVARSLFAGLDFPVFVLPGNHDVRSPFREVLLSAPAGDAPVNQVEKLGDWSLVLADSSIPGRDDGYLDDATLSWLDGALATDAPTLVCFHHPPTTLGGQLPEKLRMTGEDRLAAVLGRHSSPVAVVTGHAHTAATTMFAGLPLVVGPGVVSTANFPWEPGHWLDYDAPVSLAFLVLEDERRFTVHTRPLRNV